MKKNPAHDQDPGYVFFNLKMAYDKYDASRVLFPDKAGYFAARVRMFLDLIDQTGIKAPDERTRLEVNLIREKISKYKGPDMEDFKTNPDSGGSSLPPYEPFAPQGGGGQATVVSGEKQTRLYRLLTMKHALKIEKLGMKMTRGVNVTQLVKREFGFKGNRDKIIAQFEAVYPDIMAGLKPLPGWKEEPYAWFKNRPPNPRPEGSTEHPFETMQNNPTPEQVAGGKAYGPQRPPTGQRLDTYVNNPPEKRLYMRELQQKDDESDIRRLEMLVDKGERDPRLSIQFWRDVTTYGLREAYIYLKGYAESGLWSGNLEEVKAQVNQMLRSHGRTNYVSNPSEPTYEPDPFRKDEGDTRPPEETGYPQIYFHLFKNVRKWRDLEEAGDPMADQVYRYIYDSVKAIEGLGTHAPEGYEKKYEKIRNFFMIGYQSNPGHGGRRQGAGRPSMYHGDKPFLVQSQYIQPVRFRTMNAAVIFAREKAEALKAEGKQDIVTVTSPQLGLVAKYVTTGPVFEQRIRHDPRRSTGSEAPTGGGLVRRKHEFEENPWLVAGPQVNILPEGPGGKAPPGLTPSTVKQPAAQEGDEDDEEEGLQKIPLLKAGQEPSGEAPVQMPVKTSGRTLSPSQHKRRAKIARHQRRNKHGRFYDNGRSEEGWDGMFLKVYESPKRGQLLTVWFKFDSGRQIVTVRATETKGSKTRGYEIDILADDQDAAHIYKMLRKKGIKYVIQKLRKKPFATRAYEQDLHVTQPTSGYASAEKAPSAGAILLPYRGTQDAVDHAQTLYEQVAHEVAEGDFKQAVSMLLKIRELVRQGNVQNLWALEMASDKAKRLIDDRWPGAIKRMQNN